MPKRDRAEYMRKYRSIKPAFAPSELTHSPEALEQEAKRLLRTMTPEQLAKFGLEPKRLAKGVRGFALDGSELPPSGDRLKKAKGK